MLDFFTATISVFEAYLGQSFPLTGAAEGVDPKPLESDAIVLTLVEAKLLPKRNRPNSPKFAARDAFSLIWHGPQTAFLAQGSYNLIHPDPAVGLMEGLFITAVGQDENGYLYQSIFN